jgi:hypothetical protein
MSLNATFQEMIQNMSESTLQLLLLNKIVLYSCNKYYFLTSVKYFSLEKVCINNSALPNEECDVTYWLLISIYQFGKILPSQLRIDPWTTPS